MHDEATLWKLLDRELPPAEAAAIEQEAKDDPALRARIEELRAIKAGTLDGAPQPPPGFADRIAERSRDLQPAPVLDLEDARRFLRRALVAAAVLAAVGLTYLAIEVVPDLVREPVYADNPLLPGK